MTAVESPVQLGTAESPKITTFDATIGNNTALYMANGLQPIESRWVRREGEDPKELPVSAVVHIDDKTLWLTARIDAERGDPYAPERIAALEVEEDGSGVATIVKSRQIDPEAGYSTLYTHGDSYLGIERQPSGRGYKHKDQWCLRAMDEAPVQVTVSEATNPHVEEIGKRKSWIRRLGTAALTLALLGPTATQTINGIEDLNPYYHASGDVRQMLSHSNIDPHAVNDVANLMGDLQVGNTKAIVSAAETYAKQNPEEIITDKQRQEYLDKVNAAQTNSDAITALSGFMGLYGKSAAEFTDQDQLPQIGNFNEQGTPLDDTKRLVSSIINAYSILPKSLIENARLDTILIANSASDKGGVTTTIAAGNGTEMNIIALPTESGIMKYGNEAESVLEGDDSDYWVPLHELGHARQAQAMVMEPKPGGVEAMLGQVLGMWVSSPDYTSMYVASAPNKAEPDADLFAAATSPATQDRNGLASPTSYVGFHSPTNVQILERLAELDSQGGSGAAAWILAHNTRLMGDSALH